MQYCLTGMIFSETLLTLAKQAFVIKICCQLFNYQKFENVYHRGQNGCTTVTIYVLTITSVFIEWQNFGRFSLQWEFLYLLLNIRAGKWELTAAK
jgi:hypothetical protein